MVKYRKKPVVIEAWQMPLDFKTIEKLQEKSGRKIFQQTKPTTDGKCIKIGISTLEGVMTAKDNDWVILGVENEVYPCKDSVFKATYERVD